MRRPSQMIGRSVAPPDAGRSLARAGKGRWLRSVLPTFSVLALIGVLAACQGDRAPERQGPAEAQRGGAVTLVELADIDKPLPLIWESSLDSEVTSIMFLSLLQTIWEDGRLRYQTSHDSPMALAWHYEYLPPDSSAMRFHMRSDVLWSDSTPVTAHDVVWTYQAYGDPRVASPRQDYLEHIESITAENDSTVLFRFRRRYPEMLFHANLAIVPRHVYEGHDPAQLRSHPQVADPVGQRMVVSGPFRIAQWNRGQTFVLEPNPVFQPRPLLDRVVVRVLPEETTRMVEFQTGRVDMMSPIPYDKVDLIRQIGDVRIERREGRNYEYIGYNPRTFEPFRDPEIRRALGLALDKEGIMRALQMEEWTRPAGGPYSPIFQDYYDPQTQAPLPYNPDEARRILESKGWTPGPDGILQKNGRPFRFTLVTNAGNQRRADVSQVIQQQWRRIGVDMRIQMLETNTFFDRLTRKNFEAALAGWGVALSPDISSLWRPDIPFNFVSYENPEVMRLFDEALAQPTEEQWRPYWREAAARIVADQPYTWLYFYDELVAVRNRLRNTRIDTLGTYQNMWEWWVSDGQRTEASR